MMVAAAEAFDLTAFVAEVGQYRKRYQLSWYEMAAGLNVSDSTLRDIRKGKNISLRVAALLAIFCDISLDKHLRSIDDAR